MQRSNVYAVLEGWKRRAVHYDSNGSLFLHTQGYNKLRKDASGQWYYSWYGYKYPVVLRIKAQGRKINAELYRHSQA